MISASARRLSVFKAVVEEGGFNRAAMRLDISQPSVGAHVRALEHQAGHTLFERKRGSRPRLTKAGEAVYSMALEVLRRGEEAAQQLDDLRPTQEIMSLAVHREYGQYRLPALLASFARRSPGIRFVTHTGTVEDVVALVRARTVSLGLFPSLGAWPASTAWCWDMSRWRSWCRRIIRWPGSRRLRSPISPPRPM